MNIQELDIKIYPSLNEELTFGDNDLKMSSLASARFQVEPLSVDILPPVVAAPPSSVSSQDIKIQPSLDAKVTFGDVDIKIGSRAFQAEPFLDNILPPPRATQLFKCRHCEFIHTKPLAYLDHITVRHVMVGRAAELLEGNKVPHGSITMESTILLTRIEDAIRSASVRRDTVRITQPITTTSLDESKNTTPCRVCGKRVGTQNYARHLRMHTEKKWDITTQCGVCGMTVVTSSFARHAKLHTGQGHSCHLCSFRSIRKCNLKRHIIKKHGGEGKVQDNNAFQGQRKSVVTPLIPYNIRDDTVPYRCKQCNIGYYSKNLSSQCEICHPDNELEKDTNDGSIIVPAEQTTTLFSVDFLRKIRHLQKRRVRSVVTSIPKKVSCRECLEDFARKQQLLEHIALKHPEDRPYSCTICKTNFKLARHLTSHLKSHYPGDNKKFGVRMAMVGTPNQSSTSTSQTQLIIGL